MWILLLYLAAPLLLLLAALAVGTLLEHLHLRSIERREQQAREILLTNLRQPPPGYPACDPWLCVGSVVIGSDYFKRFGASLKTLVGGRLRTLESLLLRARREALLRMIEQARARGADLVCNVRLETSQLGASTGNNRTLFSAAAEIVAYGTAVRRRPRDGSPYRQAPSA